MKESMCRSTEPFVFCMTILGNVSLRFHERQGCNGIGNWYSILGSHEPREPELFPALQAWGRRYGWWTKQRTATCDLISSLEVHVPLEIKECMCSSTEPFVRCMIMLGNVSLRFHERRASGRLLSESHPQNTSNRLQNRWLSSKATSWDLQAKGKLESSPPELLGQNEGTPKLKDLFKEATGIDIKDIRTTGDWFMCELPWAPGLLKLKCHTENGPANKEQVNLLPMALPLQENL